MSKKKKRKQRGQGPVKATAPAMNRDEWTFELPTEIDDVLRTEAINSMVYPMATDPLFDDVESMKNDVSQILLNLEKKQAQENDSVKADITNVKEDTQPAEGQNSDSTVEIEEAAMAVEIEKDNTQIQDEIAAENIADLEAENIPTVEVQAFEDTMVIPTVEIAEEEIIPMVEIAEEEIIPMVEIAEEEIIPTVESHEFEETMVIPTVQEETIVEETPEIEATMVIPTVEIAEEEIIPSVEAHEFEETMVIPTVQEETIVETTPDMEETMVIPTVEIAEEEIIPMVEIAEEEIIPCVEAHEFDETMVIPTVQEETIVEATPDIEATMVIPTVEIAEEELIPSVETHEFEETMIIPTVQEESIVEETPDMEATMVIPTVEIAEEEIIPTVEIAEEEIIPRVEAHEFEETMVIPTVQEEAFTEEMPDMEETMVMPSMSSYEYDDESIPFIEVDSSYEEEEVLFDDDNETGMSLMDIARREHEEKKQVEEALARETAQQEHILNIVKGRVSFNEESKSHVSIARAVVVERVVEEEEEETLLVEPSDMAYEEPYVEEAPANLAPSYEDDTMVIPIVSDEEYVEPTVSPVSEPVYEEETMVIPTVSAEEYVEPTVSTVSEPVYDESMEETMVIPTVSIDDGSYVEAHYDETTEIPLVTIAEDYRDERMTEIVEEEESSEYEIHIPRIEIEPFTDMEQTMVMPAVGGETYPEEILYAEAEEYANAEPTVEAAEPLAVEMETPVTEAPIAGENDEVDDFDKTILIPVVDGEEVAKTDENESKASLLDIAKQAVAEEEEIRRIASNIVDEPIGEEYRTKAVGTAWYENDNGTLHEEIAGIECAQMYEGRFKNGPAQIYWQNGAYEQRYYVDNVLHGPMERHYADGRVLTGRYMENSITGQAVMTYPNGDREECHLVGGKREGLSILHKKNGDRLESYWNNDKRDGQSTYYWASGTQQAIEFTAGLPNGRSTIRWADGLREERQYIDGMMQNHIIRYKPTGEAVEGHYENDQFIVDRELSSNII